MSEENICEAYSAFASVYDSLMDDVPYEDWRDYLCELLGSYDISDGLVLDLGCGTGTMTRLLQAKGYDMIGVEVSDDMLIRARENSDGNILYLLQDMREFELYGTVRAVVSVCDCMNYITCAEELEQVFSLVNNYLDPGGIFVFDMNTIHKYRDVLGETTIAESRDDCAFIWDNYFDEEEMVNEYDLTLFVREEDEIFRRYREYHCQKAYHIEEVEELLAKAGLRLRAVYDAYSYKSPDENSERVCFVAMECTKMP